MIGWQADSLTFPTVPDDACDGFPNVSGSHVSCAGLTAALEVEKRTLATGEIVRPELVLLDDVQTRESSMSPSQSAERLKIINSDVLEMGPPGREITAVALCTIVKCPGRHK